MIPNECHLTARQFSHTRLSQLVAAIFDRRTLSGRALHKCDPESIRGRSVSCCATME
jgi:hypothetical protein